MPLTSKGKNYFGVCPFHDDHSPSMSVSKDKQIYKCFPVFYPVGNGRFNIDKSIEDIKYIIENYVKE